MNEWLALEIIVAGCFLTGWFLLRCFVGVGRHFPGGWLAYYFASFAAGVLVVGWVAFLLAEVGWFSIPLLGLVWLVLTAGLYLYVRQQASGNPEEKAASKPIWKLVEIGEYALLGVWFIGACFLFFRPHEFIIGGADAGVYVNLAGNIAESGRILIDDPLLADLDQALYPALLRELPPTENASVLAPYYALPGFYITDSGAGEITPQFFHLHPVWQAVAFGLDGVRSALLLNGLWAMAGCLTLFFLVRQMVGRKAALLALLAITFNALQVWFGRYPTTEMLTQFLLWVGMWALVMWLQAIQSGEPQEKGLVAFLGLLAGLALGQVFLVRIDMYFYLVVPAVLWLWLRQNGRWRGVYNWFFVPLGLMTVHSVIHAFWQSGPYAYNLFAYGLILIRRNWLIPVGVVLLGIGVLVFFGRFMDQMEKLSKYRRSLVIAAIVGVVALALYGYFLRPVLGETTVRPDWFGGGQWPRTDHENLVRLGWYLSPVGIGLAVAGICLMIWRLERRTAVILTIGLLFSLLYLWRIQANPHQIYASRRYVPVTLPFAIFAGAYLIGGIANLERGWLKGRNAMGLAAVLALVWLGATGLSARGFISQVDYEGLIDRMHSLDLALDPNSVVIFNDAAAVTNGDIIGTPLQYLYGHTVYSVRDAAALDSQAFETAVAGWQAAGHEVFWVGDMVLPGLPVRSTFRFTIESQHLEGVYDRKPVNIVHPRWQLEFSRLGAVGD